VNHLRHNLPLVRMGAMFEKLDSLSVSKQHSYIRHRNRQAVGKQRRLVMGRQIVGAFVGVGQFGHPRVGRGWHEPVENLFRAR